MDKAHNPNGVASARPPRLRATTPLGLEKINHKATQGSSCLATLGWRTQSLWDCKTRLPFALRLNFSSSCNFERHSAKAGTPNGRFMERRSNWRRRVQWLLTRS